MILSKALLIRVFNVCICKTTHENVDECQLQSTCSGHEPVDTVQEICDQQLSIIVQEKEVRDFFVFISEFIYIDVYCMLTSDVIRLGFGPI